ncbi:MAG TPA: ATP-binding protein [Clostridiales bacterium]|nr:ATP-binding protein [Clostridiales bacterium]
MRSIAVKLWTAMMLLIIIMLALLWFFQIVFLENFYINQRVEEVKNRSILIIQDINVTGKEELETRLESLIYDYNCNIDLIDTAGKIIYSNAAGRQMPMMGAGHIKKELMSEVLSGKTVTTSLIHPRFNSKYMLIGIPVKSSTGEVKEITEITGALLINMPLAPVADTAGILKKQLVYICFVLFSAALLLSFLLSRSFIKPILKITEAADKMASGNFNVRISSESKDEIGKLSRAINNLGEELSKIEQLRRDLIANVSHELRTPLSLIRGYAETIRDVTGNNKEKREKQIGIIIDESERLNRIVDDILNLSQIQSGNVVLNTTNFNLNRTIRNVIGKYEILSNQSGISVVYATNIGDRNNEVPAANANIMVKGDEARIEQVLYNLINNAFSYSKSGDSITVKTLVGNGIVKVEISDMGEGISPENIKHIWDRYYKSDKSVTRKQIGTGLGLAIVKSILEVHKSRYGVESALGNGTTFWFELDLS